jgi:hypothetical protein
MRRTCGYLVLCLLFLLVASSACAAGPNQMVPPQTPWLRSRPRRPAAIEVKRRCRCSAAHRRPPSSTARAPISQIVEPDDRNGGPQDRNNDR